MEPIRLGTAMLDDDALVEEFESCRLPASQFHHADHIRLAWIFLGRHNEEEATARIEEAIRRFASHNGVPQKYHHTITIAWMKLVAAARRATPEVRTFDLFAARNLQLFDLKVLNRYYTPERLADRSAKDGWVEPDLLGLPGCGDSTSERASDAKPSD
ncbi:MAG TPA: hypothetical protein VEU11_08450 [Terriglobales bacterium]|nr:hypothetical protein [Terriglobales bacterium]